MSKHALKAKKAQSGFTIIELMIATTVLSVILILVTTMMIGIGNLFYKGVTQSRVQDGVRSISDEVSQHLQLSGTVPMSGTDTITNPSLAIKVYCIGGIRYSYITNVQIGQPDNGVTLDHVLWRDMPKLGCVQDPVTHDLIGANLALADPSAGVVDPGEAQNSAELVPPGSRLTEFCIGTIDAVTGICNDDTASPYTITVGIAYGSDDLLCDPAFPADCAANGVGTHMLHIIQHTAYAIPPAQVSCKGGIGDQFCATAVLTTTVANRL